jgi:hypothetical protein
MRVSPEGAAAPPASCADAVKLCARAAVALDRAATLYAQMWDLRAAVREASVHAAALRDRGAARRLGTRSRALPPAAAPVTRGMRAAGRVVRRAARRPQAAATAGPSGDTPDAPGAPPARWAGATVYAERTIAGPDRDLPREGIPGDPAGQGTWRVRELDARGRPGAQGPRCLVFEHHEIVRRVWQYPATWVTLPVAALLRLAGLAT